MLYALAPYPSPTLKSKISMIWFLDLFDMTSCNFFVLSFGIFSSSWSIIVNPVCFACTIVFQILCQCHQCIGMTTIENLSALTQWHKAISRPSSRYKQYKWRNMTTLHQPFDNFIQCSLIRDIKLLGTMWTLFFSYPPTECPRSPTNLGNSKIQ